MVLRLLAFALLLLLAPALASAAVLIEAREGERDLRLVIDRAQGRVLLERGGARTLFDLHGGDLYVQAPGAATRKIHAYYRPGHHPLPPYRIELFGPGPVISGHASVYHVLFVEDRVCAEVLVSAWMRPFMDPAVRALALLDQLEGLDEDEPCGRIPFATLAAAGWPLLAGKIDHPTFKTLSIRFDYQPPASELALPERYEELALGDGRRIGPLSGS